MASLSSARLVPRCRISSASTHDQPKSSSFKSLYRQSAFSKPSSIPTLRLSTRSQRLTLKSSSLPVESKKQTGMGNTKKNIFDSEEDLAVSLAKYTADLSQKFAKERGAFTVVVSGGSLIKSLRKLTEAPYLESVEWSKWHIFWVDERVVKKDHPDSNYKLAYDGFLSKVPIPPGQVYAINDTLSPEGAAEDYETCLKQLVKNGVIATSQTTGFPKFDLQLLGMGPDGHVASLFPGHPLLEEKQKWVTFIKDSPKPPPERITFTFPVINSSAYIAMVVCGSGKADPVAASLGGKKGPHTVSAELVKAEDEMCWFLDNEAASKL